MQCYVYMYAPYICKIHSTCVGDLDSIAVTRFRFASRYSGPFGPCMSVCLYIPTSNALHICTCIHTTGIDTLIHTHRTHLADPKSVRHEMGDSDRSLLSRSLSVVVLTLTRTWHYHIQACTVNAPAAATAATAKEASTRYIHTYIHTLYDIYSAAALRCVSQAMRCNAMQCDLI